MHECGSVHGARCALRARRTRWKRLIIGVYNPDVGHAGAHCGCIVEVCVFFAHALPNVPCPGRVTRRAIVRACFALAQARGFLVPGPSRRRAWLARCFTFGVLVLSRLTHDAQSRAAWVSIPAQVARVARHGTAFCRLTEGTLQAFLRSFVRAAAPTSGTISAMFPLDVAELSRAARRALGAAFCVR